MLQNDRQSQSDSLLYLNWNLFRLATGNQSTISPRWQINTKMQLEDRHPNGQRNSDEAPELLTAHHLFTSGISLPTAICSWNAGVWMEAWSDGGSVGSRLGRQQPNQAAVDASWQDSSWQKQSKAKQSLIWSDQDRYESWCGVGGGC